MAKNKDVVEVIKDVPLLNFARKKYYEYGISVLEDRAFPDYRDGMNPVNRRILWSAFELNIRSNSKLVKSARIVGDVLGRYHPHGDAACYSAMVKMTNTNTAIPTFDGEGNWGTLSDKSFAAMRYTETRLSKFSDEVIFNKFYIPAIEYVPNFDGSGKEPLLLPALLPLVLISGKFGIAPGATTNIPICEYKSLLKALYLIYQGQEITPQFLYDTIKFKSTYGGIEHDLKNKEDRLARRDVFTKTKGKVVLHSNAHYNEATRTLTVTRFARDTEMESIVTTLADIAGVHSVTDDSATEDLYGRLTVVFKKGLTANQYVRLIKFVEKTLSSNENYVLNFTSRFVDETGQSGAKVLRASLTDMLTKWIEWRTKLEKTACSYWINEDAKTIRRLELLILAVDHRKLIIESLDKDCSQEELNEWLAKKIKIKVEEASFIYDLRVKQLRKLERKDLVKTKEEVEANKSELEARRSNPHKFMAQQLKTFAKLAPGEARE